MKTILVILLTSIMMSCNPENRVSNTGSNKLKVEKIMGDVDHGLFKVQLNDSTTVLIYRGVESCTMIQLK